VHALHHVDDPRGGVEGQTSQTTGVLDVIAFDGGHDRSFSH
jgi:hypothetical protein